MGFNTYLLPSESVPALPPLQAQPAPNPVSKPEPSRLYIQVDPLMSAHITRRSGTASKTPLIFVTHLPSASSFYASILQPLGLQFLFSPPPLLTPFAVGVVLNYGYVRVSPAGPQHVVIFSITQSLPGKIINPARITLSAGSEKAVRDFYAKSEILNSGLRTPAKLEILPAISQSGVEGTSIDIRAITKDFDNNML